MERSKKKIILTLFPLIYYDNKVMNNGFLIFDNMIQINLHEHNWNNLV